MTEDDNCQDVELEDELREYICHKIVHARPMNRGDYNIYKHWSIPPNEDPTDKGYLVIYSKGSKDHYESWSPKHVFDAGYKIND